ncbi:hypothetical protein [Pseudomonas sp. OV226]|uniref:hypothetical protein n=1 Tax=Pseudomonas sp. OV226 TaxID=2135588 RepID=UPI000D6DA092|nr:hypothetical protein [Pseudomonas sp. OV226]PWK30007.1 hypothetical protein C7534_13162 [Pseudomonas sp. OV226]
MRQKNYDDDIRRYCSETIAIFISSHPPRQRALRHLVDFLPIVHGIDPAWHTKPNVITTACREFLKNRRASIVIKTGMAVKEVTVISDYGSLRNYLSKLQKARLLPTNTLIPPVPKTSDIFSEKECNVLGYITLEDAVRAPSLDSALDEIANQITTHRVVILEECKKLVFEGYLEFSKLKKILEVSDINRMRGSVDNLDYQKINPYGQAISFFSKSHPKGMINTIAFIADRFQGLFTRRTFHGAHHAHEWSTSFIRQHLGITDEFAVAAMCIIIDELGINVQDLQNAKVQKTKDGEFVVVRDDGGITVSTLKPRANAIKQRTAVKNSYFQTETAVNIDANTALSMLLEMRANHARALNSNYLFVMDGSSKPRENEVEIYRLLNNRRKTAFSRIIGRLPPWVSDAQPTMPKIRVSQSLLRWIESGGDTLTSSIYLGNSILTALKNYVPPEIQEFVYRKRLRDHQNIILLISDGLPKSDTDTHKIASNQLKQLVRALRSDHDQAQNKNSSHEIYFLCTKETIELVLSYVKFGQEKEVVETCKSIIKKIEDDGSRKMIKMLAEAEPKEMSFEF